VPRVPERHSVARHRDRLCIVVACEDAAEAADVGCHISQVHTGTLVTYRKAEDILLNAPAGRVALIVLAGGDDPSHIGRILSWIRRRWPRCPVAVIGNGGDAAMETAARIGGASYLARPVGPEQWVALVGHVLTMRGRIATEAGLG